MVDQKSTWHGDIQLYTHTKTVGGGRGMARETWARKGVGGNTGGCMGMCLQTNKCRDGVEQLGWVMKNE